MDSDSNSQPAHQLSGGKIDENEKDFVKGDEFDGSVIDPDEETLGKMVGIAQNDGVGSGSVVDDKEGEVRVWAEKVDNVEKVVVSGEAEKGVPRVRVLSDEEEEEEEEWGEALEEPELETNGGVAEEWDGDEDAVVEDIKVDVVEVVRSGVAVVGVDDTKVSEVEPVEESPVKVDSGGVENVEAPSENKEDSSVEKVNMNFVEAVKSGVAVGVEDKKESEVEPVEESSVKVDSTGVENVEVPSENKEDSSVEKINMNFVEALKSGVAVGVEDKKESEVEPVEEASAKNDVVKSLSGGLVEDTEEERDLVDAEESKSVVAEEKEEKKDSEVEVVKESDSVKSDVTEAAGVKFTEEGDAVVDSINVDAAEAVRSRIAVVGDVEDVKDSETVVENSVVEKHGQEEPKVIEADESKVVEEGDSVVDAIEVDVVEAVRRGVAVVGESESVGVKGETREVEAPAVENVIVDNKFAPLPSNSVESVELEKALTNNTELPQTVETPELPNTEKDKSETDIASTEKTQPDEKSQSTDVDSKPDANSDSVEVEKVTNHSYASALVNGTPNVTSTEKTQPNHIIDEDEKITNRSYTSVLVDEPTKNPNPETEVEIKEEIQATLDEGEDSDVEDDLIYFGNGNTSRKDIEEMETNDDSGMIDGQVVTESDEEGDSDEEGEGNMPFDSAALAALLRAATNAGTDPSTITVRSQDGSRLFSVDRPVGLEPSLRSVRPSTRANNSSFFNPTSLAPPPSDENLSEEDKKKLDFLQQLKVKFLRLVQRAGFTAEHSLAAQVLYKLTMFGGRPSSPAFSLDNAKQKVIQLESEGKDDLDFSLNVLVLGKTGVGKSAIINSIFGEEKVKINAFEPETTTVNMVSGIVDGVKIRFIDAPGLKSSAMEQNFNRKVLASVKKLTNKFPPDVMFYVDRLDSQTRDLNDLPLLKTISNSLGNSIWRNAIVTLTHASSAPPDGPSGTPLSYEVFVAQRSHIVQQSIGQAVGEMRLMNLNMMNPVSLVENHPNCRKNRDGQKILPNGQAWRPQLLLLCYSVKILAEASASSKTQDVFDPRKLFGYRTRSAPLPYLLSSLLQPRTHPKLSADQGGDGVDSDIDLDDLSDSDQEEEENEYDELPPFKPMRKIQLAKLTSDQKKAYFEEYDYRVKILQRKQLRDELKRMKEAKKDGKNNTDPFGENPEDYEGENGAPAPVAVPLPDMTLPPSFDGDNPAYRYRFLEPTSQFLARPVLDPHGWDHDCGYEGVNVEHTSGIAQRFPASITVQLNKDKKDFNIHLDSAISAKHSENGSSLLGFDVQTIGKQYAYIVRGESKFKNLKKNKTAAGITVTFLGENVATGLKVEDQIALGKRLVLVGSTGTVRSNKDAAYGANMEVRLREADYPVGQEQSSFTLSLMKWRGDLAIGANLQSQVSVGRNSKVAVRAALNNKMSGQITVRTSSSDHMSLALAGLMPIVLAIYQKFRPGDVSENYSIY